MSASRGVLLASRVRRNVFRHRMRTPADVAHGRSAVDRYYDHTWWDFRFLWFGRGVPVMHFGHYDATTRRHAEAILRRDWILAQRVRLRPGDRVLDAGCGAG